MGFTAAIRVALQNYASFKGRARRQEFAWTLLLGASVWALAWLLRRLELTDLLTSSGGLQVMLAVGALGLAVRRVQDAGRSGWWLLPPVATLAVTYILSQSRPPEDGGLLRLLAGLAGLLLLAGLGLRATPGDNAHGADPRAMGPPVFQPPLRPSVAIRQALRRGLRLRGRACRAELLWFTLFQAVVFIPLSRLARRSGLGEAGDVAVLAVLLVPAFSLAVRRLHGMGRSGWWAVPSGLLVVLLLVIAAQPYSAHAVIVLLYPVWFATMALFAMLLFPGTPGANAHGPPELTPAGPS